MTIRDARDADLPDMMELERLCFEDDRRASRESVRHSLRSPRQKVRVVSMPGAGERAEAVVAASVLVCYARTLRVYSVAVHPAYRRLGLGQRLMDDAEAIARAAGCVRISLEADAHNTRLIDWYGKLGFEIVRTLPDYYAPDWPAVQMARPLPGGQNGKAGREDRPGGL